MSNSMPGDSVEGVAIVAMAGRFPGAGGVEAFWQNLCAGVESIARFTREELLAEGLDPAEVDNPNYVRARGVLDHIDLFDAAFFGFTPREAEITDPQQRLFLECAWEALERAGYTPQSDEGRIGVYAGMSLNTYFLSNLFPNRSLIESAGDFPILIGNDRDYLATRISYKLNLKGPSMNIQTACSTSLAAVHLACQSLLTFQCDMALAGGASVSVPQKVGYLYQEGGIASPDGHCRTFDAKAQGTVRGDGVAIVVLKRLEDALQQNDFIYAVIKGSAVNNDGSAKVGYTAPSVDGQATVIAEAQALADLEPDTISYIEAHGTGTPMGDPIEVAALTKAFHRGTGKKGFCAIGSVKTNVGHLDAAAGVTGLIKAALALKHRRIPPSLHFEQPNPEINFNSSPFYVNTKLLEWKSDRAPRRAGVSSFGIGGTNAHMVLEEPPPRKASSDARPWQLLLLSARTSAALETATRNLQEHLEKNPDENLADVAHTLQLGRQRFTARRMLVCRDAAEAIASLDASAVKRPLTQTSEEQNLPVVFMFPGQGAQYVNMARELYQCELTFRRQVDTASELLKPHLGLDLRSLLYPADDRLQEAARQLKQTFITQAVLFVIEYALSKLWMEWGVQPQAMIGHSIGEYVAMCLAGVLNLDEALRVVAVRGRLMQQMPTGAMLAVPFEESSVRRLLGERLALAAVNGPALCVVSGPVEDIQQLKSRLSEQAIQCQDLETSHAFHSQMMGSMLEAFTDELRKVNLRPPTIPYISNVTGSWITDEQATDPRYYARHLAQTVRFADGLGELLKQQRSVLLEVGPGRTLASLARRHPDKSGGHVIISSLRQARDQESDEAVLLNALGRIWMAGAKVKWSGFYAHERRHRIPLPTYPFERQRYWVEPQESPNDNARRLPAGKRADMADWFYTPLWKQSVPASPGNGRDLGRSRWVVFLDACGLGSALVQRLEQETQDVISVLHGESFARLDDQLYTISPRAPGDYQKLFKELQRNGRLPNRMVHLWNVTTGQGTVDKGVSPDRQELGLYSLIFLAQALGENQTGETVQIEVVSNGLQKVTGEEDLCCEKATLLGACRVIPQEYANIKCRSIDITLPLPESRRPNRLVEQLIKEFASDDSEATLAYRGGRRWVQTFEAVRLDHQAQRGARLRDRGTYLITGGLGGIGLELAQYLARSAQAKLILVGRSTFPVREMWEAWLATHSDEDKVSRKIRQLHRLEALGADVTIITADVADYGQMRQALDQHRAQIGEIHGVIHAAGIAGGGVIQRQSVENLSRALAAKMRGLQVLDRILEGQRLDFIVLCSSHRSLLGGAGRADYCAANAFLDAYAQFNESAGGPFTVSINWDTWREAGMAAGAALQRNLDPPESLKDGLLSQEGVETFARILTGDLSQVIVSTHDFNSLVEQEKASTAAAIIPHDPHGSDAAQSFHPRPELANEYVAPSSATEQIISDIWRQLLGIEPIGVHDNFFELGGDSIISLQVIARASQCGLRLKPKDIFEKPTIAELAAVAGEAPVIEAEQGLVTGGVPLTPIQSWFYEQRFPEPHHYNQEILFETREPLNPALLEKVVEHLLAHHDALRLRFTEDESGWHQRIAAPDEQTPFVRVDLSPLPEPDHSRAIEEAAARMQVSLDLSRGPLMRVAQFDLGPQRPGRLLIVIHHLAVDGVSWRILLEDFQTAYRQLSRGEPVALSAKTNSFKQWAARLKDYAASEAVRQELPYWTTKRYGAIGRLPIDYTGGINTVSSTATIEVALRAEETDRLLHELPKNYRTQINDVLMTILVQVFARWTSAHALMVDMEGHGRDAIFEDVDVSRTVGWFTTIFPVILTLNETSDQAQALEEIKAQFRLIPNHGIGYGLLRYCSDDPGVRDRMRMIPQAEVSFLYLGQFNQVVSETSLFRQAGESSGPVRSPLALRKHLLEISAAVVEGELQMAWIYSERMHKRSTIESLANDFIDSLGSLINYRRAPATASSAPDDLADFGWSQADFQEIVSKLNKSPEKIRGQVK